MTACLLTHCSCSPYSVYPTAVWSVDLEPINDRVILIQFGIFKIRLYEKIDYTMEFNLQKALIYDEENFRIHNV